jgi:phosphopantetheine--protein transferase-like protein
MSKIRGCGLDIEDLYRFKSHIPSDSEPTPFVKMIFSKREIDNMMNVNPDICFPLGFSCKEAIFKALGKSWTNSELSWKDIELIFHNKNDLSYYSIELNGYAKQLYEEKHIKKIESEFRITDEFIIFQAVLFD